MSNINKIILKSYGFENIKNITLNDLDYSLKSLEKISPLISNIDLEISLIKNNLNRKEILFPFLNKIFDKVEKGIFIENHDFSSYCEQVKIYEIISELFKEKINFIFNNQINFINTKMIDLIFSKDFEKQALNNKFNTIFGKGDSLLYFENTISSLNFLKKIYNINDYKEQLILSNNHVYFLNEFFNNIVIDGIEDLENYQQIFSNSLYDIIKIFDNPKLFLVNIQKINKNINSIELQNIANNLTSLIEKDLINNNLQNLKNSKNHKTNKI